MIAYLKGTIINKSKSAAVININGIGFEINIAQSTIAKLEKGDETELFVCSSFSQYDGTVLYGFISEGEKELFELFRRSIPKTGAKKALEYLNKALKSPADFQKAVATKDAKLLTGIFGFSEKTAEKIINSLKDKISELAVQGRIRINVSSQNTEAGALLGQVLNALVSLGYKSAQARKAVEAVYQDGIDKNDGVEHIIKKALRKLSV